METCGRLVQQGHFTPELPVGIIARSYTELLDTKAPLVGMYIVWKRRKML